MSDEITWCTAENPCEECRKLRSTTLSLFKTGSGYGMSTKESPHKTPQAQYVGGIKLSKESEEATKPLFQETGIMGRPAYTEAQLNSTKAANEEIDKITESPHKTHQQVVDESYEERNRLQHVCGKCGAIESYHNPPTTPEPSPPKCPHNLDAIAGECVKCEKLFWKKIGERFSAQEIADFIKSPHKTPQAPKCDLCEDLGFVEDPQHGQALNCPRNCDATKLRHKTPQAPFTLPADIDFLLDNYLVKIAQKTYADDFADKMTREEFQQRLNKGNTEIIVSLRKNLLTQQATPEPSLQHPTDIASQVGRFFVLLQERAPEIVRSYLLHLSISQPVRRDLLLKVDDLLRQLSACHAKKPDRSAGLSGSRWLRGGEIEPYDLDTEDD